MYTNSVDRFCSYMLEEVYTMQGMSLFKAIAGNIIRFFSQCLQLLPKLKTNFIRKTLSWSIFLMTNAHAPWSQGVKFLHLAFECFSFFEDLSTVDPDLFPVMFNFLDGYFSACAWEFAAGSVIISPSWLLILGNVFSPFQWSIECMEELPVIKGDLFETDLMEQC